MDSFYAAVEYFQTPFRERVDMGSPQPNHLELHIVLGDNYEPVGVRYHDEIGCGHESPVFQLDAEVADLVTYHDNHRMQSHKQPARRPRCPHEAVEGVPETRCTLLLNHAVDSDTNRRFEKHKVNLEW